MGRPAISIGAPEVSELIKMEQSMILCTSNGFQDRLWFAPRLIHAHLYGASSIGVKTAKLITFVNHESGLYNYYLAFFKMNLVVLFYQCLTSKQIVVVSLQKFGQCKPQIN